jgi:hypothetical protein
MIGQRGAAAANIPRPTQIERDIRVDVFSEQVTGQTRDGLVAATFAYPIGDQSTPILWQLGRAAVGWCGQNEC